MTIKSITSANNQRVKDAVKLRDRGHRDKQGRFLIDGSREIVRAIGAGVALAEAFVCDSLVVTSESQDAVARLKASHCTIWHVTPEVFEKLAFGHRLEGVLAMAETPRRTIDDLAVPPSSLVAVLSGLEKPGNVGAILRSADAAGVAAVIVADGGTDLHNPNCIRASLGTAFGRNVREATTADTLAWLRQRDFAILSARLDAERAYTDVDYRGNVAIVLGCETTGLTDAWQGADITPIAVPMHGAADSLNVSATAAILFYEALRQRQASG